MKILSPLPNLKIKSNLQINLNTKLDHIYIKKNKDPSSRKESYMGYRSRWFRWDAVRFYMTEQFSGFTRPWKNQKTSFTLGTKSTSELDYALSEVWEKDL